MERKNLLGFSGFSASRRRQGLGQVYSAEEEYVEDGEYFQERSGEVRTRSSLKGGDEDAKAPLCPNHRLSVTH